MTTPVTAIENERAFMSEEAHQERRNEQVYEDQRRSPRTCLFKGFCCIYTGFSTALGCRGQNEFLCLQRSFCLECGRDDESRCLTIGVDCSNMDDPGVLCRLGVGCLEYAIRKPRMCCGCAGHSLCINGAGAFPFHPEYLAKPVCAVYCLQCLPECDVAAPTPPCPALYRGSRRPTVSAVQTQTMMDRQVATGPPGSDFSAATTVPVAVAEPVQVAAVRDENAVDPTPLLQDNQ